MKKALLLIICTFVCAMSYAQMSIIRGYFKTPKVTEVSLFTIEEGKLIPFAKTKIANNGSFAFAFEAPYEGFYVVGVEANLGEQTPIYLKPGDSAELTIGNKTVQFSEKNTPENKVVADWTNLSQPIKNKSIYFMGSFSNFEDFFPAFETFVPQAQKFATSIKTKNKNFNELMKDVVRFETDLFAINFIRTPRSKHPEKDQYISYYSQIVKPNYFPNDNILKMMYGERLLGMYVDYAISDYKANDEKLNLLSTNAQKGLYVLSLTRGMKSYNDYTDLVEKYGKYITTPSQKKTIEDLGANLYQTKPGTQAANFTYPDINGKPTSLTDFKGKVVLVDVWATWCGPCKQQIPAMKALEKELHGKDIVFLSVSVDEDKDLDKWKQMVKDEQLGGIHLFASGWSKIAKDYKITGIPRFMVFDRNGNIVTVDAPRPSTPELKAMLLDLIK